MEGVVGLASPIGYSKLFSQHSNSYYTYLHVVLFSCQVHQRKELLSNMLEVCVTRAGLGLFKVPLANEA